MHAAGCLSGAPANPPTEVPRDAILGFVASAPSPLIVVSLEDLLGMQEQPNLPGTSPIGQTAHPNWMQALPMDVEQIFSDAGVECAVAAIGRARSAAGAEERRVGTEGVR